jgi:hypothetical protein
VSKTFGDDYKGRKEARVFDGVLMYFPDAVAAVAAVSVAGNKQHNPGEKLHWAREKSTDQMNTALRHMIDYGRGEQLDTDGTRHLAKAAWRVLAELQLSIEAERVVKEPPEGVKSPLKDDSILRKCACGKCDLAYHPGDLPPQIYDMEAGIHHSEVICAYGNGERLA